MLLTDQDDDGLHISGLIMNFFHSMFPSLLKRDPAFLVTMRTPLVRISLKNEQKVFYNTEEVKKYLIKNPAARSKLKYYKGLGTSSNQEVKESFGKSIVEYQFDNQTNEVMDKLFHDKFADKRKDWIEGYNPDSKGTMIPVSSSLSKMDYSEFLDKEMIRFSIADCNRSIPNLMDGLKESQRKILHACFLRNLSYSGKTMKVAQLAGFVSEKTNYHHGEQCLFETITKMAQDFVGANNIPLLFRDGQFGSLSSLGKDAANARYIFTKLDKLTRLIFPEEEDSLLEKVIDDGEEVEPKWYCPIIPMLLVNGSSGIGTGWSCNVPCFNPKDIINCIRLWLDNKKSVWEEENVSVLPELKPWYNGFKGSIERVSDKKFISSGILSETALGVAKGGKIVVKELPISMSIDKFKDFIETQLEEKKIKNYKNYSGPNNAHFEITPLDGGLKCDIDGLKLKSTLSTTNVVLFNEDGLLRRYQTIDEVIDSFCKVRYSMYVKRKESQLKRLESELSLVENKHRFIIEVINKKLILNFREEEDVVKDLDKGKFLKLQGSSLGSTSERRTGYEYLLNMRVSSFTKTKLDELEKESISLKKTVETLAKKTPSQLWKDELGALEAHLD